MTANVHPQKKIYAVMELYFEGYSVRIIGEKTGLSKNSATGIITRNRDKPIWDHLHRKKRYVIEENPERKSLNGTINFPPRLKRLSQGVRHRKCQYIKGEPSSNERCKCGRKTNGGPYCKPHHKLCNLGYPERKRVETPRWTVKP